MRYPSPLRYPGGKSALARFLTDVIDLNDLRGCVYYEPYAGGAGAAIALLVQGAVSELFLNDADARVHAFWAAALNQTERFVESIGTVPLTIDEWKRQYEICANPQSNSIFDVGFSAFYMNRCNRSGVLTGAGPIGGYAQFGRWRMDVRFNRENLSARIIHLGKMRDKIHISCRDAVAFLKAILPRGRTRRRVFAYLDPPYVNKGQRLYLNAYEAKDHAILAEYMLAQRALPWIMSYDDNSLVRKLYLECKQAILPIQYSLQEKRTADELIIAPNHVALPSVCRLGHNKERSLRAIA
jgi:DNA adenine methylase